MAKSDIQSWYRSWKKTLSCSSCNFNGHHSAIEFHHVNPEKKGFSISSAVYSAKSWEDITKIRRELKKCVVLCSNCHRITHWNMANNKSR